MRVGFGFDVHRLVQGRELVLGGVTIPHCKGLLGHSDADVLTHSIIDALLGAMGKGDIGIHFPDADDRFKDIKSTLLLDKVYLMLKDEEYKINNIDCTILGEKPKLSLYFDSIRENIAKVLNMDMDLINIKATTTEGLGFTGREEGMAAYAVACIEKYR